MKTLYEKEFGVTALQVLKEANTMKRQRLAEDLVINTPPTQETD